MGLQRYAETPHQATQGRDDSEVAATVLQRPGVCRGRTGTWEIHLKEDVASTSGDFLGIFSKCSVVNKRDSTALGCLKDWDTLC